MNNKERFDKIVKEVFQLEHIDENMTRENTENWDSMMHLMFVSAIEDEFDVMLDSEDILNLNTYQDGLKIVEKYSLEM